MTKNSNIEQIQKLNSRIDELLREREAVHRVLNQWQEKLSDMEDMKKRGDLTKDWGECSLLNARKIVNDLGGA